MRLFKPSELSRNVVFLKARVRFVPLTSDFSFLGTNLVKKAIYAMVEGDCDEVSRAGLFPPEVIRLCIKIKAPTFKGQL